ncbi:MAG: hypothetical protein QM795_11620 [Pseudoxanthomonas sp.]
MNQPLDKLTAMPAHGIAHAPWKRVVGWALFVVGLALLLGSSLTDLSRTPTSADASAIATPAFVFHDLRDHGEPREEQHRETPAKKARLTTLKVLTERTASHARGTAFHLQASLPVPGTRSRDVPTLPAAPGALHRPDPALSLHYGQAPPAA